MADYSYVYFFATLVAFLLWLFIFFVRKGLRREMLLMTGLISVLGITQIFYAEVYWSPVYLFPAEGLGFGLEDILLAGFLYGGIGSVLYQAILNQKYVCPVTIPIRSDTFVPFLALIVGAVIFFVGHYVFAINPIYTSTLGLLGAAATLAWFHPSFLAPMFFNGLLFGGLAVLMLIALDTLFPGYIAATWNLPALSGHLIQGVPLEEFTFHFAAGAAFALAYEILYHCRLVRLHTKVL